ELHLFPQSAAGALHDVALNRQAKEIGGDDLPAILRHGEALGPHLAGGAVDLDFRNSGDAGAAARGIGDALADVDVALELLARADVRLPAGFLGHSLDHRNVARVFEVADP